MNTEKCRYSTSDKVKVFAESASAMDDRGERFKLGEAAKNRREREGLGFTATPNAVVSGASQRPAKGLINVWTFLFLATRYN